MATWVVTDEEVRSAERAAALVMNVGQALHERVLSDGRVLALWRMALGNTRLVVSESNSPYFDDGWCYQHEQRAAAWRAVLGWDGEGEPEGWYRNPQTGRRRPDGDPAREYVYW